MITIGFYVQKAGKKIRDAMGTIPPLNIRIYHLFASFSSMPPELKKLFFTFLFYRLFPLDNKQLRKLFVRYSRAPAIQ
ncbi:hypothetical protein CR164_05395 [Prosthecochloris marina]|uniref:Uncharacterized protein n=1 Tax=Prosthecochloris marina TaxID=2017681 RepID=A0A317TA33_9CHLB|nr:hypothetical protein CR164_05395 [Prosthecochloris marina]